MRIFYFAKIWRIITWPLGCHSLNLCFSFIFYVATLSTHGHETPWTRKNIESQRFSRGHAITCPRFPVATKKLTVESEVMKKSSCPWTPIYNIGERCGHVKRGHLSPLILVLSFLLSHEFCHHLKPLSTKQLMGFVPVLSLPAVTKLLCLLSLGSQGFDGDEEAGFVSRLGDKTPAWRCSWAG